MTKTEERDQLFCEVLYELGSMKEACQQLGISVRTGRNILKRNRHLIADITASELASLSYKAVHTVKDTMDNPEAPKQDVALKAAQDVLDRIGASKRQAQDITVESKQPVILLPAKDQQQEAIEVEADIE